MIRKIMHKEILSHVTSFKLYPLTVVLLTVFVINGVYFSLQYGEQRDYYGRQVSKQRHDPLNRFYHIAPNPGSFCCAANEKQASVSFWIRLEELGLWQENSEKGNIFLPFVQTPDWAFIVQILFSLLMILLSYNTISDELENRTLALVSSNAVPRWGLYIGKFTSMLLIAAVVLLLSMLAGLITILVLGTISVDSSLLYRLGLFFVASLFYGSLFIFIGMGMSILARRSTISLLLSMSVWLFFIILVPESLDVLIKRYQTEPSDYELTQMYNRIDDELQYEMRDIREEINARSEYTEAEKERIIEETRRKIAELNDAQSERQRNAADYILMLRAGRHQSRHRWKKLSPAVLFLDIAEKLTFGGNFRFLNFLEQVRRFTSRFQDDMYRRYGVTRSHYSYVRSEFNGEVVVIQPDFPEMEHNGMELTFREPGALNLIKLAMIDISTLLFLVVLFGVWSFIGFVRCDVRG